MFEAYRKPLDVNTLGCIACAWGELAGETNLYDLIFPALILLGRRWETNEIEDPLYLLTFGYIDSTKSWKLRYWEPFVLEEGKE